MPCSSLVEVEVEVAIEVEVGLRLWLGVSYVIKSLVYVAKGS